MMLEDCDAIVDLHKTSLGYDLSKEATYNQLVKLVKDTTNKLLVAVSKNRVVGYIHARDYDTLYFSHAKDIMAITISNDYQGQGIGKKLVNAVEEWAKETNAEFIRVNSGEERELAHVFYERCGYKRIKKQVNFRKNINK